MSTRSPARRLAAPWLALALAGSVAGCGGDDGAPAASRDDGTWRGETSQGRAVELVIEHGRIAIFEIGYRVAANGTCSRGGDVTLLPDPTQNWIRDDAISFTTAVEGMTPADGTLLTIDGRFGDEAHLSGRLAIDRDPPCSTESYLWSAARGAGLQSR